ncbi:MAG: ribonuclease H-like YkuK family protein, partial [Schleiferiaceae bacterium]
RHPGKGVHYILTKKREPIISDMITRLFKEAEDSIKVAEYLKENGVYQPITIDVDYNENEEHRSHKLIPMVKGWILGLGYQMNTKQNIQVASVAADHML